MFREILAAFCLITGALSEMDFGEMEYGSVESARYSKIYQLVLYFHSSYPSYRQLNLTDAAATSLLFGILALLAVTSRFH